MQEDHHMRAPQWKFEWNINTLLNVVTIAGFFVFGGMAYNNLVRNDQAFLEWRQEHEEWGKEQLTNFSAQLAALNAHLEATDEGLDIVNAQVDRNTYRVTQIEATVAADKAQREKLIETLNQQATELRVIREILSRIEEKQGGAPRPSNSEDP